MRTLVVTGVSSGIGYETAKLAVGQGVRVFGGVRTADDAARLMGEFGINFSALLFDVRNEAAVRFGAEHVRGHLAGTTLWGLVTAAGAAIPGPLLSQPFADVREQIETDLLGAVLTAQIFGPMLGVDPGFRGPPGRLVLVSAAERRPGAFLGGYAAAKAGLEEVAVALRQELRVSGVAVSVVRPAAAASRLWRRGLAMRGRYAGTPHGTTFDAGLEVLADRAETGGEAAAVAAEIWRALAADVPVEDVGANAEAWGANPLSRLIGKLRGGRGDAAITPEAVPVANLSGGRPTLRRGARRPQ